MRRFARIFAVLGSIATPAVAQDEAPLSAIDWLSQSVTVTAPARPHTAPARPSEPPIAQSATVPQITVTPLDSPSPDGVGLLSSATTGLPRNLWSASAEATIVTLVRAEPMATLPALQDFRVVLMLAEADPPLGGGPDGALFQARVDKLLSIGALDQALALLEEAGPDSPALFRRWFDVALLTGTENAACDVLKSRPGIAPTTQARVFCLARAGDWPTAALTLNTARVLGDLPPEDADLLARFLDPELFDDATDLPPADRMTPLTYRIREAIGESVTTTGLPVAFAHADLRITVGWKAQLDAAERLARAYVLPETTLRALFTNRKPSASGGVWDRVEAFQRFDVAIESGDPVAVARTLPAVWNAMKTMRAETLFARIYAGDLARLPLRGAAADIALEVALLGPDYEAAARAATTGDAFLLGLAQGQIDAVRPRGAAQEAVAAGFTIAPPEQLVGFAANNQLGEGLLRALATFDAGLAGDHTQVSEALAFFRAVGLEDLARRAALQYLLLDRPT